MAGFGMALQVILAMTRGHMQAVQRIDPRSRPKSYLLGGEDQGIEDPIGAGLAVYRSCRDRIAAGLQARLAEIIL